MNAVRTCVGCRQRDLKKNLVRAIAENGVVRVDLAARLPGRGVWFHQDCSQLVLDRNGFRKALGEASTAEFEAWHRQAREDAGNKMSSSK
jgi:predicted RNA-binding protein YlxR (DUF448 family)